VFSFYCDQCGEGWKSLVIPFASGGFTSVEHEEARQLLWAQEHKAAFDQANLEAHWHFNYCAKCGKWVCDTCFDADGQNEHICKKCAG